MKHHDSHGGLMGAARDRRADVDAIFVPAGRHAEHLDFAMKLARASGTTLVLLCSREAKSEDVFRQLDKHPGIDAHVVEVPSDYTIPGFIPLTSLEPDFGKLNAGRKSDLSLKRNLGLLIGRKLGWDRIVFLDDDIRDIEPHDMPNLGGQLDVYPVAAMASLDFPDNSVVCHANRLAGNPQGVFGSGSVLGVHVGRTTVPFFPDVYNEDWLFFHEFAGTGDMGLAGSSRQLAYNPYEDPERAAQEEFGDLLAEGLYARLENGTTSTPDQAYWQDFRDVRAAFVDRVLRSLRDKNLDGSPAIASLESAQLQLQLIKPADCVAFLQAMRTDRYAWDEVFARAPTRASMAEALDDLDLRPKNAATTPPGGISIPAPS